MLAVDAVEHAIRLRAPVGSDVPGILQHTIGLRNARRLTAGQPFVADRTDELADARLNFRTPARAVEDAVVADALLHIMHLLIARNADAEVVSRFRLPKTANVV